jgi:hypothetical protein
MERDVTTGKPGLPWPRERYLHRSHGRLPRAFRRSVLAVLCAGMSVAVMATRSAPAVARSSGSTTTTTKARLPSPPCSVSRRSYLHGILSAELHDRVAQLEGLRGRVERNPYLSVSNKTILLSDLVKVEIPGIKHLENSLRFARSCQGIRHISSLMIHRYRVYYVMTPQTNIVVGSADVQHQILTLTSLAHTLSAATGNQHGGSLQRSEALLTDAKRHVATANQSVSGLADLVLAQTPEGYPGNKEILARATMDVRRAQSDLGGARRDLAQVIEAMT